MMANLGYGGFPDEEEKIEIASAAVRRDGMALLNLDPWLRGERQVVLAAVGQNGMALQAAGSETRADEEIVLTAVQNTPLALNFAHFSAHTKEIVLTAVRQHGLAYGWLHVDNHDVEIALTAFRQNPEVYDLIPLEVQTDPLFIDNKLGFPGDTAMVVQMSELRHDGQNIRYRATVGLAGREITGNLDVNANLGDLARCICDSVPQAQLLHLILPGTNDIVSPLSSLVKLTAL